MVVVKRSSRILSNISNVTERLSRKSLHSSCEEKKDSENGDTGAPKSDCFTSNYDSECQSYHCDDILDEEKHYISSESDNESFIADLPSGSNMITYVHKKEESSTRQKQQKQGESKRNLGSGKKVHDAESNLACIGSPSEKIDESEQQHVTVDEGSGDTDQVFSDFNSMRLRSQMHYDVRGIPADIVPFQPARGCVDASDFVVRTFISRLRLGMTVVKHPRNSRAHSSLRVLYMHPDGRSLTWQPLPNEKRKSLLKKEKTPKFNLSDCLEVRHAWTSDPKFPKVTGTEVLRNKCSAQHSFKSFSLIFPKRTLDFTALTSDQCVILMQGFSALCFRLQIAMLPENETLAIKAMKPLTPSCVSTALSSEDDGSLELEMNKKKNVMRMHLGMGPIDTTPTQNKTLDSSNHSRQGKFCDGIPTLSNILTCGNSNQSLGSKDNEKKLEGHFQKRENNVSSPTSVFSCHMCTFLFG